MLFLHKMILLYILLKFPARHFQRKKDTINISLIPVQGLNSCIPLSSPFHNKFGLSKITYWAREPQFFKRAPKIINISNLIRVLNPENARIWRTKNIKPKL